MFNGSTFRSKKPKSDCARPANKRLQLTKVEDTWIGVAFGSPTHPPTSIPKILREGCEDLSKEARPIGNPSPTNLLQVSRYKKLGNLFKSRSSPVSISAPSQVCRIDGDQKFDMPITRKPLPLSKKLPSWVNAEHQAHFAVHMTAPTTPPTRELPRPPQQALRPLLPKLEIQIPNADLDRYSVMFGHVPGVEPSNLLERRSRHLQHMRGANDAPDIPPVPAMTLPQLSRPTTPTHQRKSSTYSLFPSPPKSKRSASVNLESQLPRRQLSFSSRSRTASEHSTVSSEDVAALQIGKCYKIPRRKVSDISSISPDDTIASSGRYNSPWRSSETLPSTPSSCTSIGSEIFFDLKPALDSDGREPSQYFINQPDSPAVELAISNSRKARRARNKSREENKQSLDMTSGLLASGSMSPGENKWRLSLELNQAIAEIEKLTSPLVTRPNLAKVYNQETLASKSAPAELLPPIKLSRRLNGLAIGFPSPITEHSEEFSPRQSPKPPVQSQLRQHIASLSVKPAPLNISNESLEVIEDFALTPPPVPVKDAKYIPISKFAGNKPSVKVVNHQLKRRKPKRAITDSAAIPKHSSTACAEQKEGVFRPATMSAVVDRSIQAINAPRLLRLASPGVQTVSVQPTAEVLVARTMSIERRQSRQISVSSSKPWDTDRMEERMSLSPGRCISPTFHEGRRAHQPGASLNLVVESAS